jgi:hypothetical protein
MNAPLLDTALADEIFSATNAADLADLRELVRDFEGDVSPRFAELHLRCTAADAAAPEAQRNVHGLRGVVANFGLARAAERLWKLETGWREFPPARRSELLSEAEADLRAGMVVLRQRHPGLG